MTTSKSVGGDDDEDEWRDDAGMDQNAGGNAGHVTKFPFRRVGIQSRFNSLKANFYQYTPVGPRVPACTYCVANGHTCMDWIQKGRSGKGGTGKIATSCTHCAEVKHKCIASVDADADSGTPIPAPPRVKTARAKTPAATTKAKPKSAKSSGGVTKAKPKPKGKAQAKGKAKAKPEAGAGCMFSSLISRA